MTLCVRVGRGGGARAAEEDAAAGERPRPDAGEAHERQPAPRGEGEGPPERESAPPGDHSNPLPFLFLSFIIFREIAPKRNATSYRTLLRNAMKTQRNASHIRPNLLRKSAPKGEGGGGAAGEEDAAAGERACADADQPRDGLAQP